MLAISTAPRARHRDVIGLDLLGRDLMAEDRPDAALQLATGQCLVLLRGRPSHAATAEHDLDPPRLLPDHGPVPRGPGPLERRRLRHRRQPCGVPRPRRFSFDVADPDDHRWQVQAFGPEQHELIKPTPRGGLRACRAVRRRLGTRSARATSSCSGPGGPLALSRWCQHGEWAARLPARALALRSPRLPRATYTTYGDHTGHLPNVPPLRLNPITLTDDGRVLVDTNVVDEWRPDEPPPFTPVPAAWAAAAPA